MGRRITINGRTFEVEDDEKGTLKYRELTDFDEYDYHGPTKPVPYWVVVAVVAAVVGGAFWLSR